MWSCVPARDNQCEQVANDQPKARKLFERADDVEQTSQLDSKQGFAYVSFFEGVHGFTAPWEELAIIRVSQAPSSLGVVVDANSQGTRSTVTSSLAFRSWSGAVSGFAALTMFGLSKREFVGQSVTKLIPDPFAEAHGALLVRFLASGNLVHTVAPRWLARLHCSRCSIVSPLCCTTGRHEGHACCVHAASRRIPAACLHECELVQAPPCGHCAAVAGV